MAGGHGNRLEPALHLVASALPLLLLMAQDAPRYISPEEQQRRNMMKMIKNQKKVPEATDPVAFFQTHISKY